MAAMTAWEVRWLIAGYLVGSLLFAVGAARLLQKRYPGQRGGVTAFFFFMMVVMPLVGWIVAAWVLAYLLGVKYQVRTLEFHTIHFDEFFERFPKVQRRFGEGAMHQIMHNEHIPITLRLSALTMLAEYPDKRNLALIKQLLSSHNDEIRLFSFSVIDGVEHDINEKIHKALQIFEKSEEDSNKIRAAEQLAYLYWELVYLELADEVLTDFLLREVERYASYAVERKLEVPRLCILLGRVAFEKGRLEEATAYFHRALECGKKIRMESIDYILPYLAEIAFRERNFREVAEQLKGVKNYELNTHLNALTRMWVR